MARINHALRGFKPRTRDKRKRQQVFCHYDSVMAEMRSRMTQDDPSLEIEGNLTLPTTPEWADDEVFDMQYLDPQ